MADFAESDVWQPLIMRVISRLKTKSKHRASKVTVPGLIDKLNYALL